MDCFVKQLKEGQLPESLPELTALARSLAAAERIAPVAIGMIIAAVKENFGPYKLAQWIAWCREELALTNANYRCHLTKIGEMLNGLRKNDCCVKQYQMLLSVKLDNLLAVTRIPADQLLAFLDRHPNLAGYDRNAVRAAVAVFLGEEPKPLPEQPVLPGFAEALEAVWQLEPEQFLANVQTVERAQQSLRAGMGFIGAALEFEKRRATPDVLTLQSAKAALESEIHEIEEAIARATDGRV